MGSLGRQPLDFAAEFGVVRFNEEIGHRQNVLTTIAQRWNPDVNHVEPIVKILPEHAVFHLLGQVAIGGRDDAGVDLDVLQTTEAAETLVFEHPQQLGLQGHGEFADFVEEQSAVVGQFEQPALLALASVKAPFS